MVITVDLWAIVNDVIDYFEKTGREKIPVSQFIKKIENKYKIKMSKECKEQILIDLQNQGIITVVTSKNGKKYVIVGDFTI